MRYNRDVIYTYVGEILVAMNPYKSATRIMSSVTWSLTHVSSHPGVVR